MEKRTSLDSESEGQWPFRMETWKTWAGFDFDNTDRLDSLWPSFGSERVQWHARKIEGIPAKGFPANSPTLRYSKRPFPSRTPFLNLRATPGEAVKINFVQKLHADCKGFKNIQRCDTEGF